MTTNVTGAGEKRGGGRRRKGRERRDFPFRRRAHSEMRRFFSRNILSRSAPSHASRFVGCSAVYTPRTGISFPDSRFPIFPRFLPFWRRGRGRRQSRAIPPVKRNSLFAGGGGRGGEQKRATGTRGDGLPRIFNFVPRAPPPRGEYLYACSSRKWREVLGDSLEEGKEGRGGGEEGREASRLSLFLSPSPLFLSGYGELGLRFRLGGRGIENRQLFHLAIAVGVKSLSTAEREMCFAIRIDKYVEFLTWLECAATRLFSPSYSSRVFSSSHSSSSYFVFRNRCLPVPLREKEESRKTRQYPFPNRISPQKTYGITLEKTPRGVGEE